MVKKLGLASLFYKSTRENSSGEDKLYKTMNSAYVDSAESCFSNSSALDSESFSTVSEASGADPVEAVIRGLRSDRLFFEPGAKTSSIVERAAAAAAEPDGIGFEGGVAMAVDSDDPYMDFRASMEEMVVAHGVKDWDWLEEMLGWYLRANGKTTHGLIVGAFVDLLVGLASRSSNSLCSSFASKVEEEEEEESSSFGFEIVEEGRDVK
ncbi:transcription repressor OFP13-like [Typha latifolia]|uniref:transcription repressor OFP13-like n=1 Tax=Typha latifolia TaxID=4733 RepID=UPI003C2E833C